MPLWFVYADPKAKDNDGGKKSKTHEQCCQPGERALKVDHLDTSY